MVHYILQILIATSAAALFGYVWYSPRFGLGKVWMRNVHITPAHAELVHSRVIASFFGTLMSFVFMSLIIGRLVHVMPMMPMSEAILYLIFIWLGLVVPPILSIVIWEGRSIKLFLVNAGYWFFTMTIITFVMIHL